ARLTRATVLTVIGQYDGARRDCTSLAKLAAPLLVAACDAAPASLSGDAESAYHNLTQALERWREAPALREWGETLAAEIAARARGDSLHRREEARFKLKIENDPRAALALARENWNVQREPADLRVLLEAAHAADDTATIRMVDGWMATNRIQDVALSSARE